ncbi:flagellar basal body P-ring protein FlgI [Rubrivirga sp.]|uniref:flagellar basal body P-ring protein FlgI n=1 Tax=Rubrivirga sp. TaxID=1885344 RepID=UPI003C737D60
MRLLLLAVTFAGAAVAQPAADGLDPVPGLDNAPPPALGPTASARLKDMVVPAGAAPTQLLGYGIVVGLDRTGDRARGRTGAPYTVQSVANMLQRFGIEVDVQTLGTRNAAAVMVTATLDPFAGPGSAVDVTVASLGDARSLSGGILLQTPLQNMAAGGTVHAVAQGPILTGTLLASAAGTSQRTGPTNTGRVPSGALVTLGSGATMTDGPLDLILREPDFTNAVGIADVVNEAFPGSATAMHAGMVRVEVPADAGGPAALMAALEGLRLEVDAPARVVVNERTGTVVAGGNVAIGEVMITYGSLSISTAVDPAISQPGAFSDGETVAGPVGTVDIEEGAVRSVVLQPNTSVAELAGALNELGLDARDVISIFQAIDRAGALMGELVVL